MKLTELLGPVNTNYNNQKKLRTKTIQKRRTRLRIDQSGFDNVLYKKEMRVASNNANNLWVQNDEYDCNLLNFMGSK